MPHITGQDRSQTLLLPESLDDYVAPENPVRFIEAFVDGLDLAAAGFARVLPKDTGRLLTCRPICSSSTYMVI
jgi:transposase